MVEAGDRRAPPPLWEGGWAGARGVPGPLGAPVSRPSSHLLPWGSGPRGLALEALRRDCSLWGLGPGLWRSKPPLSERFSSRLDSFICPAVIRWAGPLREQRLETPRDGFLSTSLITVRDWAFFVLASPRRDLQPQGRVSGSGVCELMKTASEKTKVIEWSETLLFVLPRVPRKARRETVWFLDYLL